VSAAGERGEVVRLARDLIRIDTSNYGGGKANAESAAADYVERELAEVGLRGQRYEAEPGRTNLIVRWEGTDRDQPALMLHGHLDVVPANPAAWTYPPFEGVIADGMLWGRGAIDMKDMVAMIVAAVRRLRRDRWQPRRDLVLAFFADEEDGCALGSQWMAREHPEAFAGVGYAIGEGGGYSITVGGRRAYLMNTGEKGVLWLRLEAKGKAGHGSLPAADSAITKLANAIARLGALEWPTRVTSTTAALLKQLRSLSGLAADSDPYALADLAGLSAPRLRAGLRNVSNVTLVQAGYKENVVPESASALIDLRFLPGDRDAAIARIAEVVGDDISIDIELELTAMEAPFAGPVTDLIQEVIAEADPSAVVLPHLIPGGTDAKALSTLGIAGYGFIPLRLSDDFNFPAMFHGVDERVPLAALEFGEDVLTEVVRRLL
jgi:acetylornithine deacetylase/succinyl-diaminopimelate desuccinylase-like protein